MSQYLLSIIVITHNEAKNMPAFLAGILKLELSLALKSQPNIELVVVDSGSQDQTQNILTDFATENPRISLNFIQQNNWQGFGYQKNYALSQATGIWVLSLDADEYLSQELAKEIAAIVQAPACLNLDSLNIKSYSIKRLNYFCKKAVKYSGWQRDIVLRLWQRHPSICFSDDVVHEKVIFKKNNINHQYSNNRCENHLPHHPYQNIEDVLRKIQNYSSLGAQKLKQDNKSGGFNKALIHGFWAFIKTFFLHLGVLDGKAGFNIALMNGLASYYKYLKN